MEAIVVSICTLASLASPAPVASLRRSVTDNQKISRREVLRQMSAVVTASALPATASSAQTADGGSPGARFFPGFKPMSIQVTGATINGVMAGQGPPVLLLHGAPQSMISWRLVAPALAKDHTVVVTDLRGYGDSSKPPDGERHSNYSKRAMALDQVEVMRHLGFERFAVIGHDRGGRVGHRMALDHAKHVSHLAVLDIVPTYYLYTHVTLEFVQAYFHWFNYVRAAPAPENQLKDEIERQASRMTSEVDAEYLRVRRDPANIHGMCEDYRAGASIDLEHDKSDQDRQIGCPVLALWGAKAPMGRLYDVLTIWRERAANVTGRSLPAGHNLQEDAPEAVLAEIRAFLNGNASPLARVRRGRFSRRG
jgi:haloacetate dehalogenase